MPLRWSRYWPWPAIAAMAFCVLAPLAHAAMPVSEAQSLLKQAEHLRKTDRPRFLQVLKQLEEAAPGLTAAERWQVRYLQAAQTGYQGDYAKADVQLRDIIEHSNDKALEAKASALLMLHLGIGHHYEEAFALANQWIAELPRISDSRARYLVLYYAAQLMGLAGQNDLALQYARMMEDATPPGESLCEPRSVQITALFNSKALDAADPLLQQAVDMCTADKRPVFVNNIQLVLASLYLEKNQPGKALALLRRIAPSIEDTGYFSHLLTHKSELAGAYWKLGNDADAEKAALAAVAMASPGEIDESYRDAYEVLYRVEKKRGHPAAALSYYQHYVIQDKGSVNDVSARAMAYQIVQQRVLSRELAAAKLNDQNKILRLQQALANKAAETSRIYIAALLSALAGIVLWLFRLKRSQLRFKRLASHDGLTGALNHQHFMGEAERILRLAEKKAVDVSLISIDLDHFKQVNDTHGHAMGDEVLKHAVRVCKLQLRASDLFGRLGGEEFGVLLNDCSREEAKAIAQCIRKAISETAVERNGATVWISTSVGLACTSRSGYGLQHLCTDADAALYRAKRAGRNRVMADAEDNDLAVA